VLDSIEVGGLARDATARVNWIDAKGTTDLVHRGALRCGSRSASRDGGSGWKTRRATCCDLATSSALPRPSRWSRAAAGGRSVWRAGRAIRRDVRVAGSLRGDWYSDFGAALTRASRCSGRRCGGRRCGGPTRGRFARPTWPSSTPSRWRPDGPARRPRALPGGVPAPGADPQTDCGASFGQIGGGNPGLEPERATNWLAGMCCGRIGLTLAATYWHISKTNNVGIVQDATILDPLYYPSLSQFVLRRRRRRATSRTDCRTDRGRAHQQPEPRCRALFGWDFELGLRLPAFWAGASKQAPWLC